MIAMYLYSDNIATTDVISR